METSNQQCISCLYPCLNELLDESESELLSNNQLEISYNPNDILIKQGSFVTHVLYLTQGIVKILIEEGQHRQFIVKLVGENNFIALPILGNIKTYPVSVVALSRVSVCQIQIDSLKQVMANNIKINRFFIDWFSNDYLYLYSRFSTLNNRNSHGKLANVLLYLLKESFLKHDILRLISRRELADMAAISIESVNKILQELKNDRIIEIENKTIRILKPELIETLSTVG